MAELSDELDHLFRIIPPHREGAKRSIGNRVHPPISPVRSVFPRLLPRFWHPAGREWVSRSRRPFHPFSKCHPPFSRRAPRCPEVENHGASTWGAAVEPLQTHETFCLPLLLVLLPSATRVSSVLLCYTFSVPTA